MSEPIALVTGATGTIGPTLVSHLIKKGYTVRTLGRVLPSHDLVSPDVVPFIGSISDVDVLDKALQGSSVVFHLAAMLHIENPSSDLYSQYEQTNVEGTKLVAERATVAGVRRIVYFSTVKVYGTRQRVPVTESFPEMPKTIYAKTKLEGERALRKKANIETVVLRLSPVYGPRMKGSWYRLTRAISTGRFVPIGNLQNVHSLTHVDDVARAAILASEHMDAAGETYNVVGHENPTLRAIFEALYASAGRKMPKMKIPANVAIAGAYTLDLCMRPLGKQSPLSLEAVYQLIEDEAYSGAKLRKLGFSTQVPLNEGWGLSS